MGRRAAVSGRRSAAVGSRRIPTPTATPATTATLVSRQQPVMAADQGGEALNYIRGFDRFILPDDTPNVEGTCAGPVCLQAGGSGGGWWVVVVGAHLCAGWLEASKKTAVGRQACGGKRQAIVDGVRRPARRVTDYVAKGALPGGQVCRGWQGAGSCGGSAGTAGWTRGCSSNFGWPSFGRGDRATRGGAGARG